MPFIRELRLNSIEVMDSANRYLQDVFIPQYWLEVISRNDTSEFAPIPEPINLDDVCVIKDFRKIRNDHTFSYSNKFYLIESTLNLSIAKQRIATRTHYNDGFTADFAGRDLAVSEVIEPARPSLFDLDIQKKLDALKLADALNNFSKAANNQGSTSQKSGRAQL